MPAVLGGSSQATYLHGGELGSPFFPAGEVWVEVGYHGQPALLALGKKKSGSGWQLSTEPWVTSENETV